MIFRERFFSEAGNWCEVFVDERGTSIAIVDDDDSVYVSIAIAKKLGAVLEKAIAAAEAHKGERP